MLYYNILIAMKKKFLLFLVLLMPLSTNATEIEAKSVIATIKPLHSLVAGVLGDAGKAELLLTNDASPHNLQLKPSQMKAMQKAHIIFYIDDSFETFLAHIFEVLPDGVLKVPVARRAGLTLLPYRRDGTWESHGHGASNHHEHEEHYHAQSRYDMHVWLDPENAKKMVALIADELIDLYPKYQDSYRANAQRLTKKIDSLNAELRTEFFPIRDKPFIVFHDAYQYLEHAYGLNGVGSITFEGSESLSPSRIKAVREKLHQTNAACVFSEPQFSTRAIETVSEDFDIKVATLDPLGTELPADENLYFKLLKNLAHGLKQCLMPEK